MAVPVFVRSLIFTIVAPCTVAGWVPYWLARSGLDRLMFGKAPSATLTDILGFVLIVIGASIYLWCTYDFTFIGRGTPAIFDPPKRLVIRGLYNYMRNPMYVGIISVVLGQVFIFGSPTVTVYAIVLAILFSSLVIAYEEPTLRRKFGIDYIDYCQRVNRWLPKV